MARSTPAVKLTYDDYRETPDDERYELLDGELVMAPAPRISHQDVAMQLGTLLNVFVKERGLGKVLAAPCDVVLSDTNVVQPDLLFVSRERARLLRNGANVWGAPDVVVEILSPATAALDRTFKRDLYARHGVKEYWLVDTEAKTVTVLLPAERGFEVAGVYGPGEELASPTLGGFSLDPHQIFQEI